MKLEKNYSRRCGAARCKLKLRMMAPDAEAEKMLADAAGWSVEPFRCPKHKAS